MLTRYRNDCGKISWHAHLMHQQDRAGSASYGCLNQRRIHIEGCRINVDKHRLGAAIAHDICSGDIGVADGNDFITRNDASSEEREMKASRAVRHRNGVLGAHIGGELFFEGRDFWALCDPA